MISIIAASPVDRFGALLQVLLTMHAPLIGKLPVLQNKHPQFLEFALTNLKLEVRTDHVQLGFPSIKVLW